MADSFRFTATANPMELSAALSVGDGAGPFKLQNIDPNGRLLVVEQDTAPRLDDFGYIIRPLEWYAASIGGGHKVWIWTRDGTCRLVVTW